MDVLNELHRCTATQRRIAELQGRDELGHQLELRRLLKQAAALGCDKEPEECGV